MTPPELGDGQFQSNKVCYKVSLCEKIQRESCSITVPPFKGLNLVLTPLKSALFSLYQFSYMNYLIEGILSTKIRISKLNKATAWLEFSFPYRFCVMWK